MKNLFALQGGAAWCCQIGLVACMAAAESRGDETWTYAVQLSAQVQASPARITLNWPADRFGPQSYTVYRKLVPETSWATFAVLPGSALGYEDSSVSAGVNYEYKVFKQGVGYTGYGYICAGVNSPVIEERGKLILIVAADVAALGPELSRLQSDLTGDGWEVMRHDIGLTATPSSVKSLIVNAYNSDPSKTQAVFLFGRVPILMCGDLEYDSHGHRPMPADAFYGDVNGEWNPDLPPSSRPSFLPSDVELMVGRVDFSNMPGIGAPSPWPSETDLLRRYLNKDHAWRHKKVTAPGQALMANRVGDAQGMAYAASGYRNFEPFVGAGNIVEANVADAAPDSERWIVRVSAEPWLWSYACGGGQMTVISHMGTHNQYKEAWSTDLVAADAKAVFSMFFGSSFGDWSGTDNLLRAMLAAPTLSLTVCMAGIPHWFVHHMAKGHPIGYSTRLTMNNTTLYQTQSNAYPRSILVNLLGDPTLRLELVTPPSNLNSSGQNGIASLSWTPSIEPVLGYHVYRSATPSGPFTRLTSSPVTSASFVDSTPFAAVTRTYMVRALALQTNPSGSYNNLSQGIFSTVTVSGTAPPPVQVRASPLPNGILLRWNTVPGKSYRVEENPGLQNSGWHDLSQSITAASDELSFIDTNWGSYPNRYYRVTAE